MSSSSESYFIYIEESQNTIPQSFSPHECFLIKLHLFHSTSFNHYDFLIPRNILCDYDEFESVDRDSFSNTFLRNTFLSVDLPQEVLEETLLLMGEYARYMNTVNFEGFRILEMDVFVDTTSNISDDENAIASLSKMLEKLKVKDVDTSFCSREQCAICLEEFCDGSEVPHIIRTKCMHVFHEHCVARWLKQCSFHNRLYSCPVCRSQIQ